MTLFSKIKEGVGYSIQKGIKKKIPEKIFGNFKNDFYII